jgi:predicted amidohydrolase
VLPELSIAYVQYAIHWHDWHSNKTDIEFALEKVDGSVDLIVLPEMFASGFTMQPEEVAQSMDGHSIEWMSQLAASRGSHVIGSLVISEEGRFYNRLICAHPDRTFSYYDKRHLFTYAGENEHYAAGKHRLTFEIDGWRICPLVCYDLRFPVWSRNTDDYDVLIYVANWPSARADAWTALLKARAIENLCYVVGLNRVGADANGLAYPGRSEVFDMTGKSVYKSGDQPDVRQTVLNKAPLKEFRARYNFLADKDSFIID